MAPRNQPPKQGTPDEQALTTPTTRPEVLLAIQQGQANQAVNSECAAIRQEIGAIKAEVAALKSSHSETSTSLSGVKRTHHIAFGVGIAITAVIGVVWYLVGHHVSTLLTIAEEREIADMHKPVLTQTVPQTPVRNSN